MIWSGVADADLSVRPGSMRAMTWTDPTRDPSLLEAYRSVEELADWSPWTPLETSAREAPREPGVYLLREPLLGTVRHAGMAGERAGGGRPQGLAGRLSAYRTGHGTLSAFSEAALDHALGDADWVVSRLADLRERGPSRTREWARDAVARLRLEVSWAVCAERADARYLERQVLDRLGADLVRSR